MEWMRLGTFVRKENEFRLEGVDMTQTAIDYIKDQSHSNGFKNECRVKPYNQHKIADSKIMRLSTVLAKYSEDSLMMI